MLLGFAGVAGADAYFKVSKVLCVPEISYFEIETRTLWSSWIPHREQSLQDNHSMFYGDFRYGCNLGDDKTGVKNTNVEIDVSGLNVSSGRSKTISGTGGQIRISINQQLVYEGDNFHVPGIDERYIVVVAEGGKRVVLKLRHCIDGKCKNIDSDELGAFNKANG